MPIGNAIASEIASAVPTSTTCSPSASSRRSQFSSVQLTASGSCGERAREDRLGQAFEVGTGRAVFFQRGDEAADGCVRPGGATAELDLAPEVDRLRGGDEL